MTYITNKPTETSFKNEFYSKYGRQVTLLEHILGVAQHEIFYWTMEIDCAKIDALFPDLWLIDILEGFFLAWKRATYTNLRYKAYLNGAAMGTKIEKDLKAMIADYKAKIEAAVTDAKAYIKTNLTDPMQKKIDAFNEDITRLKGKFTALDTELTEATVNVTKLKTMTDTLASNIKTHEDRIRELEKKIKEKASTQSVYDYINQLLGKK